MLTIEGVVTNIKFKRGFIIVTITELGRESGERGPLAAEGPIEHNITVYDGEGVDYFVGQEILMQINQIEPIEPIEPENIKPIGNPDLN